MVNLHRSCTRILVPMVAGMLGAALLAATPGRAGAQCGGDCNGDGEVTVDEIITMVNIALGAAALPACPAADGNGDGQVAIDDIIGAVNNALSGCPAGPTPTSTPTPTPTPPPTGPATPTPTWTPWPKCGDRIIDFALGETCDDGNTSEGDLDPEDRCPSNCRIRECPIDPLRPETVEVDFSIETPPGVDVSSLVIWVRYLEDRVRIPGDRDSPQAVARITNLPEDSFSAINNYRYGLRVVVQSTNFDGVSFAPFEPGRIFTATFDICSGAPRPVPGDFQCRFLAGATPDNTAATGVTCTVSAIR